MVIKMGEDNIEVTFTPNERYEPQIMGRGKSVEEARRDAEARLEELCVEMGYDLVFLGRFDLDLYLESDGVHYCRRDAALIRNLPENQTE